MFSAFEKNVSSTRGTVVGNASVNTFTHREIPGRYTVTGSLSGRLVVLMSLLRIGRKWTMSSLWVCTTPSSNTRWRSDRPGESWDTFGMKFWDEEKKNEFSMLKCESFLLCWYCLSIFLQGVIWRNKTNIHYTSTIKGTATFATPFIFLLNSHGKKDKCEKFTHSPNSIEGPTCFDFTSAQNFVGLC